jgi:type IV pilus assembly protein PilO
MNFRDPQVQRQLLIGLLPVFAAVAFYQFIYTPRSEEADVLEARVETLTSQNNTMRAIVARHGSDLERRLAIFEEHVGQLEQLIPSREDVPVLINMIAARAADSGVELTVLRPGGENPGEFYSNQSFQLEVTGPYHAVAEYLTVIGSMPRIVRSSGVNLRRGTAEAGASGPPTLRAAFRIETYVMPVPGEQQEAENVNG